MKILISLFMVLSATATFACANFTGTYQMGPSTLEIVQQGCETLTLIYADHQESYILDNQVREVGRTNQYILNASAAFVPYSPIIRMTVESIYVTGFKELYFRRLSLFSNGRQAMLLDELGRYRRDGYFVPYHQTKYDKQM